jgi:hypothetical protein
MKLDELFIEHIHGHKLTSKCVGFDSADRPILTLISDEEEKEVAPVVEEKKEEVVAEVKKETPKAPVKKSTPKKKTTTKKK